MHRRKFLQGVSLGTSSLLLSPVLRQLQAQADGNVTAKRFVFVLESNGREPVHMQPAGIPWEAGQYHTRNTQLIDSPLTNQNQMAKGLVPFEPYKDRITVVQGLSGRVCSGSNHSGSFGALGCYSATQPGDDPYTGRAYGETIDAALARANPAIFPLLVLGITHRSEASVIYNSSAYGKGKPAPTICHPSLAYSTIFGSVAEGSARQQFNADRNLLDFMAEDIQRVEPRLAGPEREKFQQHLEAFEALRDQQSRLNDIKTTLRKHAPVFDNKYKSPVESDRLDAHFDLGAAALIGGLTNVLTIASGVGGAHMDIPFRGLGINTGKHELGHASRDKGRDANECLDIIRAYHAELVVRLMKKLEAVKEGNGTMLDNTVIVFTSDAGNTHHPGFDQWPLVLIGNLGGRLKAGGRFLGYPAYGKNGHRTMANLYLSFLHAVGDRRKTFGMQDPNLRDLDQTGPLAELLA